MSLRTNTEFNVSVKIIRPQEDPLFVPKEVFWSRALELNKPYIEQHEHLWLIDSDINFEGFDFDSYMSRQTDKFLPEPPLVSQPVIKQNTQHFLFHNNQDSWTAHPDVTVAYSTLIEIQAAV